MVDLPILAQSTAILQASEYDTELASPPTGPLAYLPAVISYEALAPAMYAPLLPPLAADGPNPLAELSPSVGGSVDTALEPATPGTLTPPATSPWARPRRWTAASGTWCSPDSSMHRRPAPPRMDRGELS